MIHTPFDKWRAQRFPMWDALSKEERAIARIAFEDGWVWRGKATATQGQAVARGGYDWPRDANGSPVELTMTQE